MKQILITGAESYIGQHFAQYISINAPEDYQVTTIDLREPGWVDADFSIFDSVVHVAGIAHKKETPKNVALYYAVNRDLASKTAQLAKAAGVKQFVFLSTMSVYGMETGHITRTTEPNPKSHYGKSKLGAERQLRQLADDSFTVTILRPPMVYGKDCKGNFQSVVKLVKKLPFFPKVNNCRSMIHIQNLCAYITACIQKNLGGLHLPQDPEYMNTSKMAGYIAEGLNKKLYLSSFLGFCVRLMLPFLKPVRKAFGSLTYEKEDPQLHAISQAEAVINSV